MDLELDHLFLKGRREIERLESHYQELLKLSSEKDDQIELLLQNRPQIWLCGSLRFSILANLLLESPSIKDGIHPYHIDTKYFHVDVVIHSTSRLPPKEVLPHAIIFATDFFDPSVLHNVFANEEAEVKMCVCATTSDQQQESCMAWCVENGVEYVDPSISISRVSEALSSTVWPDLVMKTEKATKTTEKKAHQPDRFMDLYESIMEEALQAKKTAHLVSDQERRVRAAQAAEKMMAFLGMEEEESSSDDE